MFGQGFAVILVSSFNHRRDGLERTDQVLVDDHHRALIHELPAIIRRRENSHELSFGEELITVLDDLMRAANKVDPVAAVELGHDFRAEDERDAALVVRPGADRVVRVRPQQVAQNA